MPPSNPTSSLPSLKILQYELEQYRKTGRALHLAHAARALGDLRMELQTLQAAKGDQGDLAADNQEIAA
jgi:hypothetical protein